MISKKNPSKDGKGSLRIGVSLIRQLSTTFYLNSRMIFDELISNARDAFATKVEIKINDDTIEISDNGEGMSQEELVRFFYISHTAKNTGELKTKGQIKRYIIGKFGIGKLAMFQLCEWFEIKSWKGGIESSAKFSFRAIEEKTFLDEVMLNVKVTPLEERKTGTKIIMHDLKKKTLISTLTDGLSKTMPLDPAFEIYINGVKLESERKRNGKFFPINEDNAKGIDSNGNSVNLGKIDGFIIYTKKNIRESSGVYVRVFGRRVNDNPRILDLAVLTSGRQFRDRTYCELNVNELNNALLTSRSGFIEDNPKYEAFLAWLRKLLNKYNVKGREAYGDTRDAIQKEVVIYAVAPRIEQALLRTFKDKKAFAAAASKYSG